MTNLPCQHILSSTLSHTPLGNFVARGDNKHAKKE
jgi:hypothetical protein